MSERSNAIPANDASSDPGATAAPDDKTAEIRAQIVAAARARFSHFGYGKTTMSEIAEDCKMSTGNLYRFFDSKLDIAEAVVNAIRTEQIDRLREIARDAAQAPGDRLRGFLQSKLALAYERFHGNPKAFELAQNLMSNRAELAEIWERREAALIAEILSALNAELGSAIDDVVRMARVIQDATFRFTSTAVYYEGALEPLQCELDDIIAIFLDAFAHRASRPR
ncbi:MAG: hypothetical protein Tsb0010_07870 [Parvularculaceae bacterium]